jgi:hypothetical protein
MMAVGGVRRRRDIPGVGLTGPAARTKPARGREPHGCHVLGRSQKTQTQKEEGRLPSPSPAPIPLYPPRSTPHRPYPPRVAPIHPTPICPASPRPAFLSDGRPVLEFHLDSEVQGEVLGSWSSTKTDPLRAKSLSIQSKQVSSTIKSCTSCQVCRAQDNPTRANPSRNK